VVGLFSFRHGSIMVEKVEQNSDGKWEEVKVAR
jgi:hypothetical protein